MTSKTTSLITIAIFQQGSGVDRAKICLHPRSLRDFEVIFCSFSEENMGLGYKFRKMSDFRHFPNSPKDGLQVFTSFWGIFGPFLGSK